MRKDERWRDTLLMLFPKEGIHSSQKNGLFVGLLGGLACGLVFVLACGLALGLFGVPRFGLTLSLFGGLFGGLSSGLLLGLTASVQYYILRFWLTRSGIFPWLAIPFLEDATTRILLRRVGRGYSFAHRLLLDYFADAYAKTSSVTSPTPFTSP
jgi:hypothetical protein